MSDAVESPIEQLLAAESAPGGSPADQWSAAKEGCAAFAAVHRAAARATGEDAESFLHGMLTNDVRSLAPGSGMPAAFLTDSGQVVADLRLYRDTDAFDLDCVSWRLDRLLAALDKYVIADDVEIHPTGEQVPLVCLDGPQSGGVAAQVVGAPAAMEPFSIFREASFDGQAVAVRAVSETGGQGRMITGPATLRDAVLQACRDAGATVAGLATLDVLRVEAGIAWAGIDMDEDTLLLEIGMPEVISRTKGCYLGQEVVERVSARGQVNRTLTAFAIDADLDRLPAGPLAVHDGDAATAVGRITSRVYSPALRGVLGMGLLHRKGRDSAALRVAAGADSIACRVVAFPGHVK